MPELSEHPKIIKDPLDIPTSLEKRQSQITTKTKPKCRLSPCRVRNVSLPNLKIRKKDSRIDREKRKAKKRKGAEGSKPLKKKQ